MICQAIVDGDEDHQLKYVVAATTRILLLAPSPRITSITICQFNHTHSHETTAFSAESCGRPARKFRSACQSLQQIQGCQFLRARSPPSNIYYWYHAILVTD